MKKLYIFITVIATLFLIILVSGMFNKTDRSSTKIKIVTTLFPYYDIARSIGKDKVDTSLLLPPGVEAHSFEPKPSDIIKINESDIFIYTGEILEPWAKDILDGITDNSIITVKASDGISLLTESDSEIDPHIWLDFTNMIKIARFIENAIVQADPKNKDFYETNLNEYISSLEDLDKEYQSGLENCQSRDIVFGGHYAFGYLGKRYNLNFVTAYGVSPDSEPSVQDITKLIDQIKSNNIKYVYYEELISTKVAETLTQETGAQILLLNPAHNITKEEYDNGTTFVSIMKYNLENLRTGLQCQ